MRGRAVWLVLAIAFLLMGSARAQVAPVSGEVATIIEEEARAAGFDAILWKRVAAIESGGNCGPGASTGSYHGLYQLSHAGFRRLGGTDIYDCRQNARAAMKLAKVFVAGFRDGAGRDPTPTETYLAHQQGVDGLAEHLRCPDCPAWQSMYRTAEYQRRGRDLARQAIWGNLSKSAHDRFGSVDNVTSRDFTEFWAERVEGPRVRECRMPDRTVGLMR